MLLGGRHFLCYCWHHDLGQHRRLEARLPRLAQFYADRTEAIFLCVSNRLSKTAGQVIAVDGGLYEAFLR